MAQQVAGQIGSLLQAILGRWPLMMTRDLAMRRAFQAERQQTGVTWGMPARMAIVSEDESGGR